MNHLELQLLREESGSSEPRLRVRTSTRVDVGLWWRLRPIWLCVFERELLLLAVGRRRYCERIAIADCRDSHYNPASGELVIAPGNPLRFPRLRMTPAQALRLVPLLDNGSTSEIPVP